MREIKFRGKSKRTKEWVYGFLFELSYDGIPCLCIGIEPLSANDYGEIHQSCYEEVIPETVGQFTGLHDKNGKEIYEDDLVAVADYANWEGLYKVAWDNDGSMYVIEDAHGDREKLCEFEEYLVKGNIHDLRNWI